jgi:predicted nucleic acid-binding Zn ribbon protein
MPIYVYEPADATADAEIIEGRECCYFETLQWAKEEPLTHCPECGRTIRRALAGFTLASQSSSDPLKGVAKKLGEGLDAAVPSTSPGGRSEAKEFISGEGKSAASRAARLAYRHVCSKNCRH